MHPTLFVKVVPPGQSLSQSYAGIFYFRVSVCGWDGSVIEGVAAAVVVAEPGLGPQELIKKHPAGADSCKGPKTNLSQDTSPKGRIYWEFWFLPCVLGWAKQLGHVLYSLQATMFIGIINNLKQQTFRGKVGENKLFLLIFITV